MSEEKNEEGTVVVHPEGVPAPAPEEDSGPDLNAVVVHRLVKDNGDIACFAEPIGDVSITEVDTILALGRKEFRERIGL